jgi:hypothetical protein
MVQVEVDEEVMVAVAVDEVVLVVKVVVVTVVQVSWCGAHFWTVYPVAPVYFSSPLRMSTDTWTNCVEIVWMSVSCAVGWHAGSVRWCLVRGGWCVVVHAGVMRSRWLGCSWLEHRHASQLTIYGINQKGRQLYGHTARQADGWMGRRTHRVCADECVCR